ncbi:MAG TPA: hypothetical protein VIH11_09590 [Gemmatimonadaceae bacterium]|nr:hypothetical protein [Gemmatimonadaceae bacterium]
MNEIKSERVKFSNHNVFQFKLHVASLLPAETKKCGETFPHIHRRPRASFGEGNIEGGGRGVKEEMTETQPRRGMLLPEAFYLSGAMMTAT